MKVIKITIENGKLDIDLSGFEGKSCDKAREELKSALNATGIKADVNGVTHKPEYYKQERKILQYEGV